MTKPAMTILSCLAADAATCFALKWSAAGLSDAVKVSPVLAVIGSSHGVVMIFERLKRYAGRFVVNGSRLRL
jgi:hypothetical protein